MKRKLALVLALVLGFSTNAFATTQDITDSTETEITGGSTIVDGVYKVVLPTNLDFAIDPFEKTTIANGLVGNAFNTSWGYLIVNQSNIPVKVGVDLSVTLVDDTFVSEGTLNQTDTTNEDKQAYVYAVPFKTVTGFSSSASTITKATYVTALDSMPLITDATATSPAHLDFKLQAATYAADNTTITNVDTAAGVAGFTLKGKVNPVATWADDDITLSAKFKVVGLTPSIYTALTLKTDGLNLAGAEHAGDAGTFLTKPDAPTQFGTSKLKFAATAASGIYGVDNMLGLTAIGAKVTNEDTGKVVFNGKSIAPVTFAVSGTGLTAGLKVTVASTITGIKTGDTFTVQVQYSNGMWSDKSAVFTAE